MKIAAVLTLGALVMGGVSAAAERDEVLSGGVRLIPVKTPKGTFRVWTKRVGDNPKVKVLLLLRGL